MMSDSDYSDSQKTDIVNSFFRGRNHYQTFVFTRPEDTLWDSESFGAAVGLYLIWQIGYWVVTEVMAGTFQNTTSAF